MFPTQPARQNPRRGNGSVSYADASDDDGERKDDSSVEMLSAGEDDHEGSSDLDLADDDEMEIVGGGRRSRRVATRVSSRANKASTNYQESSEDEHEDDDEEDNNNKDDDDKDDLVMDETPKPAKAESSTASLSSSSSSTETTKKADPASDSEPAPAKAPTRKGGKKRKSDGSAAGETSDYSPEDDESTTSSNYVKEEATPEEPREFEPFKISKVLACRSETISTWKEICANMNTSALDYGSRWTQDAPLDDTLVEERFLIKWTDLSYMHCSWETRKDLRDLVEGSHSSLARFITKYPDGLALDANERCDGDFFDPAWVQVDRIMEVHFPEACPCQSVDDEDEVSHGDLGIVLDRADPDYESGLGRQFLIKWGNQPYTTCSYEFERDLILNNIEYKDQLKSFDKRSTVVGTFVDGCDTVRI